jgi:hypothetical protein
MTVAASEEELGWSDLFDKSEPSMPAAGSRASATELLSDSLLGMPNTATSDDREIWRTVLTVPDVVAASGMQLAVCDIFRMCVVCVWGCHCVSRFMVTILDHNSCMCNVVTNTSM